jgi:hypothetical protein
MTHLKGIMLAALVLAIPVSAQTPAELLQKGVYTQETAGDLDGALRIYRQITASTVSQSPVAAQAQFRIVEVLLQKGDLNGAAMEFSTLANRFSDQQELIAKMARRLRGMSRDPVEASVGTVQNGRYRNKTTGVEVPVASTWKTVNDGSSSDNGEMVVLSDGSSVTFGIWMRSEESTSVEIQEKLGGAVAAKVKMNADTPSFAFRQASIQPRVISGRSALTAVADYLQDGQPTATIYTWIYTARTHVVFIASGIPASEVASVQGRFDQFVASSMVP